MDVNEHEIPLKQVLRFFAANTADALKLPHKGRLAEGCDADMLVLNADDMQIIHAFARGKHLIKDSQMITQSQQRQLLEEGQK